MNENSISINNKFEIIEHTADIGIKTYGRDIKAVFANLALGLFSIITDVENIEVKIKRKIMVSAPDIESLIVEWLNELLFIFEVEHLLFKTFDIKYIKNNSLEAVCGGEEISIKHILKREVKAATYHMLNLNKDNIGYQAQVILDI